MGLRPGTRYDDATAVRPILAGQGLRAYGSTSGYVGLLPSAAAGSTDYILPAADGTSGYVLQTNGAGVTSWVAQSGGVTDHGALTGLTDDDHLGYARLAGRAGGQIWYGGTEAGDDIYIFGTSYATPGYVYISGNSDTGGITVTSANLRINGSTSGYTGLAAAAAAGSTVYTLPSADGTSGHVLQTDGAGVMSWVAASGGVTDHGALTGLSDDDHSQYALLAGRPGGGGVAQTLYGGTEAGDDIVIASTSHATKGDIILGSVVTVNATELRFNGSSSGYVGLKPAAAAGSTVYTLPSADGTSGQVLSTNGSATLSWATAASTAVNYNYILNGDFDIWQVQTSFAAIATGTKNCDMWTYTKTSSSAVHTLSRSTDVPTVAESGHLSNYSMLVDCTLADTGAVAADLIGIQYRMEGYVYQNLSGQEVTFSFWHKHTKTGIHCVCFYTTDRYYIAEYTQTTTDTWEKAEITLTFTSAGTWDSTNGVGLGIFFTLIAGSNYHATKDTWNSTADYATSSVVNDCDSSSNNFRLAQLKLELGASATKFSKGSFGQELSRCQRYYEHTYDYGTYPGSTSRSNSNNKLMYSVWYAYSHAILFLVEKRAVPTVTIYNTNNGTSGQYSLFDGAGVFSSNQAGGTFSTGTKLTNFSGGGNATANYTAECQLTYDARL